MAGNSRRVTEKKTSVWKLIGVTSAELKLWGRRSKSLGLESNRVGEQASGFWGRNKKKYFTE